MRTLSVVCLTLLAAPAAWCQSSEQANLEQLVRSFLRPHSGPILIEGSIEGPLNRSGDATAVLITKVVAGDEPGAQEIERILLLLDMSFAAPKIIGVAADRQPRTTLFVLNYLRRLPLTPELKRKLEETQALVGASSNSAATAGRRP